MMTLRQGIELCGSVSPSFWDWPASQNPHSPLLTHPLYRAVFALIGTLYSITAACDWVSCPPSSGVWY